MSKVGRNDPCICGSGKKYKKCCLRKHAKNYDVTLNTYIPNNNQIELLKLLALLQLTPSNHGKNIRIEELIKKVIQSSSVAEPIDIPQFISLVHKECSHNLMEDPPENAFTENIAFHNGNNVVFPGIFSDVTTILQYQINSIFSFSKEISVDFKTDVFDGLLFLIEIHKKIASKLGLHRYMTENSKDNQIDFPSDLEQRNYFEYSRNELEAFCEKLKINKSAIDWFVAKPEEAKVSTGYQDEDYILFTKPFIKVGESYILVMPSAQVNSLCEFIIAKAKEYSCIDELVDRYNYLLFDEVCMNINTMGWLLTDISIEKSNSSPFGREIVWQIDENKLALMFVVDESYNKKQKSKSDADNLMDSIDDRVENCLNQIESQHEDKECLVLIVLSKFSPSNYFMVGCKKFENNYVVLINAFEFEKLVRNWECDKLTLWKFAKSKARADEVAPSFPEITFLMNFYWFEKNHGSFFHSDENYGSIFIDFSVAGDINLKYIQLTDKHVEPNIIEGQYGYFPVFKKDESSPIYISKEIERGQYRSFVSTINTPFWVSCTKQNDKVGENFVDCITYWLNELHDSINNILSPISNQQTPIEIILSLDEKYYQDEIILQPDSQSIQKVKIDYEISPKEGKILINIPFNLTSVINQNDNTADQLIVKAVLLGINELLGVIYKEYQISENTLEQVVAVEIPLSLRKMLLIYDSSNDIKVFNSYIPRPRYIQESDVSFVLEHIVQWLGYAKEIPEQIKDKKEVVKLCNDIVSSLIKTIKPIIKEFNSFELIKYLMWRHESLIQLRSYRKLYIPSRILCFNKYKDIENEYNESENKLVRTSLSMRCLIEFVVAEPSLSGSKTVNDDDIDLLLAIMDSIISFGTQSEIAFFELGNIEMGLLPSGRIGTLKDGELENMDKFNDAVRKNEIKEYFDGFNNNYQSIFEENKTNTDENIDPYIQKVDDAFRDDWGISIFDIAVICRNFTMFCFGNKKSYMIITQQELDDILHKSPYSKKETDAFINRMTLESRDKIEPQRNDKNKMDLYPWRYNRRSSYLSKPLIKLIDKEGEAKYLISARHMDVAAENLLALFYEGTLKVDKGNINIQNLLAERNNINGKKFRQDVYELLEKYGNYKLIPNEVNIS